MEKAEKLITENLDLWASTVKARSSAGRGFSKKLELYGISKLRELILDLAVRGMLVPQDPQDQPTHELLKDITKAKDDLINSTQIKKVKPLSNINEEEKSHKIPKSWQWIRLGDLGWTQTGGTPSKSNKQSFGNDIPFIKPGDIINGTVNYQNEGLSEAGRAELGKEAPGGSILMVCIGTIGKCAAIDRDCTFNQQINSITPFLGSSDYIFRAISSPSFQKEAWKKSSSTTISILNKSKWQSIPIPLPPLSEQHRIAARVDELISLCDQLEKEQEDNLATSEILVSTFLDALTSASADATEFAEAWQNVKDTFDILFTSERSVDQLKQTILQLAMMGKLILQDERDAPAKELLQQISIEKEYLIKSGKIKRQKNLPPLTQEDQPFKLPSGWSWCPLLSICTLENGDRSKNYPNKSMLVESGIPFVNAGDLERWLHQQQSQLFHYRRAI